MADEPKVTLVIDGPVAVVTLNNPPVNALSGQVLKELNTAMNHLARQPVKAAVLTGTGHYFAAGADVKEIAQLEMGRAAAAAALQGQSVFNYIAQLPVPVIAAVNGICLGGGNELILACHLRMASERARFGQPEINLGIIPGFGGTQRLPRLIRTSKALELLLTGAMIGAKEAEAIGLVDRIVPDSELLLQAKGLAKQIAGKSRQCIERIMKAVREGLELPLLEGLKREALLFGEVYETDDAKEGLAAFLEKRQPNFKA